jgi:hypothetical protein
VIDLRRALVSAGLAGLLTGTLALAGSSPAGAGVPRDLLANTHTGLIAFSSADPDANAISIPLTGAPVDSTLLGIDVRPANQVLYGLFTLDEGELAVGPINHTTGAVGTLVTLSDSVGGGPISGQLAAVGVDFNPVVDRLRVVSSFDDNLRIDVDSGVTTRDADLNSDAGGDDECVVGAAYTNSTPGPAAASTQLFDIVDGSCPFSADFLAIQAPPNDGTLTSVGPLGIDNEFEVGFEITAGGAGFLATRLVTEEVVPGGRSAAGAAPKRPRGIPTQPLQLYSVNLASGAATLVGTIGDGFGGLEVDGLTSMPVQLPTTTTTTATTLATTTTGAVLSSTTVVLARTGEEETAQGAIGVVLITAGAAALLLGARVRRRAAR